MTSFFLSILVITLLWAIDSRRILSKPLGILKASETGRYRSPEEAPANIIYRRAKVVEEARLEGPAGSYDHCFDAVDSSVAQEKASQGKVSFPPRPKHYVLVRLLSPRCSLNFLRFFLMKMRSLSGLACEIPQLTWRIYGLIQTWAPERR